MRFKNILLLLGSVVLVVACSSTPKTDNAAAEPETTDLLQKGFLLSLPAADGWNVVKKSDYKVFLAKHGENEDETYTLQTVVVSLPSFENDDEFLDFIKQRMMKAIPGDPSQETTMFTGHSANCVQNSNKQTRLVKGEEKVFEMIDFTCIHPDNKNAGIYMAYSKTYSPGHGDEDFSAKAEELFNHLYFTEL